MKKYKLIDYLNEIADMIQTMMKWTLIVGGIYVVIEQIIIFCTNAVLKGMGM